MQKSFFRAKQPGQRRHKKKVRRKSCAWPGTQKEGVRRKRCLASTGTKKESVADIVCDGLPKNGGDLLSQLVGQYHRRG